MQHINSKRKSKASPSGINLLASFYKLMWINTVISKPTLYAFKKLQQARSHIHAINFLQLVNEQKIIKATAKLVIIIDWKKKQNINWNIRYW